MAGVGLTAPPASALDKQGAAHQGGGSEQGLAVNGNVFFGVFPYNPSYAARPDNSGLALLRGGAHLDIDLLGQRLFIPIDLNSFTDRSRPLVPSELDLIAGIASTSTLGPGKMEIGVRGEHDRSLDGTGNRVGKTQNYGDVRVRYLLSARDVWPKLGPALRDGDVSGWLAAGWFFYNPSYFARPDNTGRALLRYVSHAAVSGWQRRASLVVDANFFTDREANPVAPSELDLTIEIVAGWQPWELHLGYERDMPIDRGGLVQHGVMMLAAWSFE